MAVTYSYDGNANLAVTINPSVNGVTYRVLCLDPNSTQKTGLGTGGSITITVNDIGGLAAGQTFEGLVWYPNPVTNNYVGCNIFQFGTASTDGYGTYLATWGYNGTNTITCDFTATDSHQYQLFSYSTTGASGTGTTGTGPGPLSLSVTLLGQTVPDGIVGEVQQQDDFVQVIDRLFIAGTADAGTPGSPDPVSSAAIVATPTSGIVGSGVSVDGTGFDASSPLAATLGGETVALSGTTSTDGAGAFTGALFTVPLLPPNTYDVEFTT